MDPKFARLVETLALKLDELMAMKPLRHGNIPTTLPEKGVYLFSKGKKHLYVGRSNALRKQFHRHFTHPRGAAFAFLLARKATGKKRNYKKGSGETRAELMKHPTFKAAFRRGSQADERDGLSLRARRRSNQAGIARNLLRDRARHRAQRFRQPLTGKRPMLLR